MFLKIKSGLLFGICLICCAAGVGIGYISLRSNGAPDTNPSALSISDVPIVNTSETNPDKINPSTKIIYEYYYTEDNITETYEEAPPYFLIGLNAEDLKVNYPNWEVINFSDKEVTMRTTLNSSSTQQYIIGEYNGLLAVYYQKPIDGVSLKELTNIPISSLPSEEQKNLKEGIYVSGNENLLKALSDYGSWITNISF